MHPDLSKSRMVIMGATGGVGATIAAHYADRVQELIAVCRSAPAHGRWIPCNVTRQEDIAALAAQLGDVPVDVLLYLGGTWEAGAFTTAYDFTASPMQETADVLAVNLTAPIWLTQALLPHLTRATHPRAVFIGALVGHQLAVTPEVANTASKFGLRGAVRALDVSLRARGIGFTLLNPSNLATAEVLDDIANGRLADQTPIPMTDLLTALDAVLAMSPAAMISELNLAQMHPG